MGEGEASRGEGEKAEAEAEFSMTAEENREAIALLREMAAMPEDVAAKLVTKLRVFLAKYDARVVGLSQRFARDPVEEPSELDCRQCDVKGCPTKSVMLCICRRCESERANAAERFYSCSEHQMTVALKHQRIREREVEWCGY
jgi:hypothetical protein